MADKKVAVVYTSMGSVELMKRELGEAIPGCNVINIVDDSLIREVMAAGRVTPSVRRRMMYCFLAAAEQKPDAVVCACSSVGAVAQAADAMLDMPVVRIDRAMIEKALELGSRIGVLASLATTMDPTVDYLRQIARQVGPEITVTAAVAQGAYEANRGGHPELHDQLILDCAEQVASQADVVILAQGSMSRLEGTLAQTLNKPVLSSPRLCALQVRDLIEHNV